MQAMAFFTAKNSLCLAMNFCMFSTGGPQVPIYRILGHMPLSVGHMGWLSIIWWKWKLVLCFPLFSLLLICKPFMCIPSHLKASKYFIHSIESHKKGLEIMIWLMMLRKKNGKNTNVFLKNFIAKYGIMLTMEYGCGMSIVSIKSDSCEKDRQKN